MKFRIISDVHLDVTSAPIVLRSLRETPDDKESILLLAGDIGGFAELAVDEYDLDLFFSTISDRFKHVCYIMGNHEAYYGTSLEDVTFDIREYCARYPNVSFLDNEVYEIEGIAILGTTLWTDYDTESIHTMMTAKKCMNDYIAIRKSLPNGTTRPIKPQDLLEEHKNAIGFLKFHMDKHRSLGNKIIVMSHHAPSSLSTDEKYTMSAINGAYCTSLEPLMDQYEPVLWIHGHMHAHKDYQVYNTRIVCNPFGYSPKERLYYEPIMVIEV